LFTVLIHPNLQNVKSLFFLINAKKWKDGNVEKKA
jgi:hypothetical protein